MASNKTGLPEWIVGEEQEPGKHDQGRVWWVMTDDGPCVRVNIVDWRPRNHMLVREEVIGDFTLDSAKALHVQLGIAIVSAEGRQEERG